MVVNVKLVSLRFCKENFLASLLILIDNTQR